MLARFPHLDGLGCGHLGRGGEDDGVDSGLVESLGQRAGVMGNAELGSKRGGVGRVTAGHRHDLDAVDAL